MGDKDITQKKLEDFDDVFADIINGLVFGGEPRVDERDLETGMVRSAYRLEDRLAEQERDAKKFWKSGHVRIALFGLENQTGEDADFIFRGIGYDGAEYRDQVRRRAEVRRANAKRKKDAPDGEAVLEPVPEFYPVVTLVLYFGDRHWEGSLNLKDHMKIPEGLDPYVSDYKVNLFEVAYLTDEQVRRFRSDFRFVAEYFVACRMRKEGKEPRFSVSLEHLRHVEEFVDLMNAVTNSKRFSELPTLIKKREEKTMLTILFDEAEERGEKRGEIKGAAKTYKKIGKTPDESTQLLMEDYHLKKEEAEKYVADVF